MPNPLRLLLIEDSEDDAELLLRTLRRGGYEPAWQRVEDAAALVAALQRQAWDLITCDWVMPQLHAPRALEIVRERGGDAAVIVVSGEVSEEYAVTAMKAGAHDFVSKQRMARLLPAVARELGDAETRRARRSAEAALAERDASLRRQLVELETIYRTTPIGLAFIDVDLRYVRINEVLAAWHGLPAAAHIGRTLSEVLRRNGGEAEALMRQVLESGEPLRGIEFDEHTFFAGEGDRVWRADYYPVPGPDGRPIGGSAVVQDVTDRKRTEAQLRRQAEELASLNAELEQRVAARTAELEATNAELRSFTSAVSHDLRAPLRAITAFSEALDEDCGAQLDAQGRDYLARVRAGARRLTELLDGLLALSRLTQRELERAPVDLSALARDIAAELRAAEPQRRVEIAIADGLTAHGDAVLLRDALANLLGNAWKFTRPRAIAHIELGAASVQGAQLLFVRDDGVGFPPGVGERIFRPFARLHGTAEFEGTGVGLSTVQRIIHRHGGRIWAEGFPDRGATFYFTLG